MVERRGMDIKRFGRELAARRGGAGGGDGLAVAGGKEQFIGAPAAPRVGAEKSVLREMPLRFTPMIGRV